jgi:hypothetical protein
MTLTMRIRDLLIAAIVVAAATDASAQEPASRADEQARRQEEKARSLQPDRKNWLEREFLGIESGAGFGAPAGFFVAFGDIKSSSGVALGPAYSRLFDSGALVQLKGVYSIRNFKLAQFALTAPPLAQGRLTLAGRARWQDAPSLAFYGLGTPSEKIRADYAETKTEISAAAELRPVRLLRFGGAVGVERFETGPPDSGKTSIETVFTDVPGLNADPEYLHMRVSAAIDGRDSDGYTRRGTLLRVVYHDFRQQNAGPYSFQRTDGTAEQFLPILHGNWVLYLGLRASTTTAAAGHDVPFFLMPDLGGGHDLRGFGNYRFRDRHSILVTAEYRWYAQEFLDAAVFYDAGKTVPNRGDLDFSGLQSDVGGGVRLHGPQTTMLRVEVAHSREGFRLILAFSPVGR